MVVGGFDNCSTQQGTVWVFINGQVQFPQEERMGEGVQVGGKIN